MSVKLMAQVWDMEMKAIEKIVLLALADYADDDGVCWPRQNTIAIKTGVSRQTVNQKMKQLEADGLLAKIDGRTVLFPVKEADTSVKEADTPECQGGRQGSQVARQECQGGRQPSKPSINHQITTKENFENQAQLIWAEYPRHVGKGAAIVKIVSALKKVGFEKLLSRTKLYAEMTANKERHWIPHPSTWFNQERYNDDPDEWMDVEAKEKERQDLQHKLNYTRDPEEFQRIKERLAVLK